MSWVTQTITDCKTVFAVSLSRLFKASANVFATAARPSKASLSCRLDAPYIPGECMVEAQVVGVPFPGQGHQVRFLEEMAPMMRTLPRLGR